MTALRFIHFFGLALWIGGAIAAMIMAISSRKESVDVRAGVFRLLANVQTIAIGIGSLMTLGSGLLLTVKLAQAVGAESVMTPRILVMQVAGLVAGLLVLLVSIPTAVKIKALAVPTESGELLPAFERYRKRQAAVSSVAGALAVIALFAAVVLP